MTDLTDEAVKALLDGATPGRRVQFHGSYCPEAVGTPFTDWDTSHDVSVIRPDGSRYRLAHYKHASDAYLSQMAPDLARALLTARAELDTTQTQLGDWIVRADEANVKVETLDAELARVRADAQAAVARAYEAAAERLDLAEHDAEERDWRSGANAFAALAKGLRALAPASALAELQALRDARTALTGDRATDFDNDAVYQFSKLMKDKMAKSRAKGRKGWNDPTQCSPDFLRHLLYEHIYKGDPVDVANLCMMLRHYDEPTTPKPEDDLRLLHTEAAEAELATLLAQVERLTEALTIAANRLHRCSVDYDTGTREFIEVGEWADEARAALTEGAAP